MQEKNQIIYSGYASLEEIPWLSFGRKAPIMLGVRDGDREYSLFFSYGNRHTPRTIERQQNIAEIVNAYGQGAKIRVTGIILEKQDLETILEGEKISIDKSIYFGLITLKFKGREQKYTYYLDYENPPIVENTILAKGDYIIPKILEMQGVM